MSRIQTLTAEFERSHGRAGVDAVRDATRSVRVTGSGELLATVDGEELYRTNRHGEGAWAWARTGSWVTDHDGSWAPIYDWKQVVGTWQLSGRSAFRAWVVEVVATMALYGQFDG